MLLNEASPAICLNCHDGDDKDFKAKHLGLSGSQINCRQCHDPHVSDSDKMLNQFGHEPFISNSCDACHTETPTETGGDKK